MTKANFVDEPTDFSLVQGGPLFQLLLRARLIRPSMDLLARRVIVIAAVGWVPLLILAVVSGHAFGGQGIPFLYDWGAQARLLLCVPLLIAAEVNVHKRMKVIVGQFLDRGIIAPRDQPQFEGVIASAMRLRNSVFAEVLLLAFAFIGAHYLGLRYVTTDIAMWFAGPAGGLTGLTPAGYWYVFVSLPLFRFLLLRWYFRLFVWYRFLWQVSRHIPLQLNSLHPDRAGGLAFLTASVFAFQPVLIAHTIALAGVLGEKISHEGARLPHFKMEILAWIVVLTLLVLAPLFFFVIHLAAAKRTGLREYGIIASRYVADFRRKWLEGNAAKDEALIGTADIQSLADLANSYAVVQETRVVPFGRVSVLQLAIMTALPLAPLLLTMIPLEELIDRVLKVLI